MSSLSTLLRGAVGSSGNLRLLGLLTNRALLSAAASPGPAQAAGLAKLTELVIAASKHPGSAAAALELLKRLSVVAVALCPGAGATAAAIQLLIRRHLSSVAEGANSEIKTESQASQPAKVSTKPRQEPAAAGIPKSFPESQGAAASQSIQHELAHKTTAKRSRLFWRSSARPRLAPSRNATSRSLHSLLRVKARDLERSLADAKQNDDLLLSSPGPFLQLINRALKTSKRQFAHARQRLQQASSARRRRLNTMRPQPRLTSSRKGRAHRQSRTSRAASRAWHKLCALYSYFLARVKLMRALLQSVTARPAAAAAGGGGAVAMAVSMPTKVTLKCDGGGKEAGGGPFGQGGAQGHGIPSGSAGDIPLAPCSVPTLATLSALWTCLVLSVNCVYKWQARKQRRRRRERDAALLAEQATQQTVLRDFCAQIDCYHHNVVPAESFLRGTAQAGTLVSVGEVRRFVEANKDKVFPTRKLLKRIEASVTAEAAADFPDQAHTRLLLEARIYLSVLARQERGRDERAGANADDEGCHDTAREPQHPLLCGELLNLFLQRPLPITLWAYMVAAIGTKPRAPQGSQRSEVARAAIDLATAALRMMAEVTLVLEPFVSSSMKAAAVMYAFRLAKDKLQAMEKERRANRGQEKAST